MIRHSPCGRAVDIARRNYSTTARPFRDSDTEVTIKWRRADPAAGTLPYPSRLCSLDWVTEPWKAEGAGEVYGADRTFLPKALPTFPPNQHICGTEQDHREGGAYLPALPPVTFREDGLPTCCGPVPEPPPDPEPVAGLTCPTAEVVEVDELFEGTTGPVGTVHWLRITGFVPGELYSVRFENASTSHVFCTYWKTDTCPPNDVALLAATYLPFDGFSHSTIGAYSGDVLARFESLTEGQSYTFRVRLGF